MAGGGGRDPWSLALELEAWGREGALEPLGAAEPTAQGRRVEYRRGPVTEWYLNAEQGLEQGFTLERAPEGPESDGPLWLVLSIDGGLEGQVLPGGRDARFQGADGGPVVHYTGLRAWDAAERELAASLVIAAGQLRIRIEDRGAVYPLFIDPWIATEEAKLTGERRRGRRPVRRLRGRLGRHGRGRSRGLTTSPRSATTRARPMSSCAAGRPGASSRSSPPATQRRATCSASPSPSRATRSWSGRDNDNHAGGSMRARPTCSCAAGRPGPKSRSSPPATRRAAACSARRRHRWRHGGGRLAPGRQRGRLERGRGLRLRAQRNDLERRAEAHRQRWIRRRRLRLVRGRFGRHRRRGSLRRRHHQRRQRRRGLRVRAQRLDLERAGQAHPQRPASQRQLRLVRGRVGRHGHRRAPISEDLPGVSGAGAAYVFVRNGAAWSRAAAADRHGRNLRRFFLRESVSRRGRHGRRRDALRRPRGRRQRRLGLRLRARRDDLVPAGQAHRERRDSAATSSAGPSPSRATRPSPAPTRTIPRASSRRARPTPSASRRRATSARQAPRPSGCQATLSMAGTASASASSGFTLMAASVEGAKDGLFFFGTNGFQANSWGNGSSFQCIVPPVKRAGVLFGTGTTRPVRRSLRAGPERALVPDLPELHQEPRRHGRGAGAALVPRPADHLEPDDEPVGRDPVQRRALSTTPRAKEQP